MKIFNLGGPEPEQSILLERLFSDWYYQEWNTNLRLRLLHWAGSVSSLFNAPSIWV